MTNKIIHGNSLDTLKTLPPESVHCCVTSPPYWGLRKYDIPDTVWGGNADCAHQWGEPVGRTKWGEPSPPRKPGSVADNKNKACAEYPAAKRSPTGRFCTICNAWQGQLGLEPTPELFVYHLGLVFLEVYRVLRNDGTLWLNLGDTYWGGKGRNGCGTKQYQVARESASLNRQQHQLFDDKGNVRPQDGTHPVIKPKELCGIPWRVAFALQEQGWYLRSDIIWSKMNVLPESVTDRPTKSHEYVFLLTKKPKYFYDNEAIKEPSVYPDDRRTLRTSRKSYPGTLTNGVRNRNTLYPTRNKRDVWSVVTEPSGDAHFAIMPSALAETCIKAGTSAFGCCSVCGAPVARVIESTTSFEGGSGKAGRTSDDVNAVGKWAGKQYGKNIKLGPVTQSKTIGQRYTCEHTGANLVHCTVLDPFHGAGTTGLVAAKLGCDYIGIELSEKYIEISSNRKLKEKKQKRLVKTIDQDYFDFLLEEASESVAEKKDETV